MESFVSILAVIICLALLPGSFVGAYFLIRKWVKNTAALIILTLIIGIVILCAGEFATVAGCAAMYPVSFH